MKPQTQEMLPYITWSVSHGGGHCVPAPNPPCVLLLMLTPGLCQPRVSLNQGVLIRFCQPEALERPSMAGRGKGLAPLHLHAVSASFAAARAFHQPQAWMATVQPFYTLPGSASPRPSGTSLAAGLCPPLGPSIHLHLISMGTSELQRYFPRG